MKSYKVTDPDQAIDFLADLVKALDRDDDLDHRKTWANEREITIGSKVYEIELALGAKALDPLVCALTILKDWAEPEEESVKPEKGLGFTVCNGKGKLT